MRPAIAGLFILLTSFLFLATASALAGPDPLPENEYWNLVETSHQTILNLKGQSSDHIKRALNDLSAQWSAVKEVRLASGDVISVDNSYLLSALDASTPDPDRIESMFASLQKAHQTYPSRIFTTADLESLNQILTRPEFRGLEPSSSNPLQQWFQNLWDRFVQWLNSLQLKSLGNINASVSVSPLEITSAILLILVLAYVLRSLMIDLAAEAQLNGNGEGADEILTADGAFENAQRLSRGGDYRSAVRYLYLSALLLLDERGLLRYDRSKTNHEVLRSVLDSPELARPLREVVDVFDNVWYGYHSMDEDSFRQYSDRVQELKEKK